jgi:predicted lipoprotein with Yx(FWY)xxD motif
MRKIYVATALLAGLASVSACGSQAAPAPADVAAEQVPVAVQDSAAPVNPQGPGELPELAGAEGAEGAAADPAAASNEAAPPAAETEKQAAKAAAPTVAKTQRWVKIFSGPSDQDITPPRSRTDGSKTVELNTTDNAQIGTYVTDGAGRTLYRFDNDSNKPPKTTCKGDCATAWPPLLIRSPGKIFPDGVDPKIVGFVERGDGTCQVTINGWPVYYFVADNKAGDINGQGLNGKWFAIKPDGGKTAAAPGPLASNGAGK